MLNEEVRGCDDDDVVVRSDIKDLLAGGVAAR
jgi:hypothetical protein